MVRSAVTALVVAVLVSLFCAVPFARAADVLSPSAADVRLATCFDGYALASFGGESAYSLALEPLVPELTIAATGRAVLSPPTLLSGTITGYDPPKPRKDKPGKKPRKVRQAPSNEGLGPERARVLLRSLTLPGWGQATAGHRGSAKVFLLAEASIWSAFTAFKIQQVHRTESYLLTARLEAGVDLRGRDDEYRRIVGAFASSEEYNLLVVTRDAANQFLADPAVDVSWSPSAEPDLAGYRQYIDEHSIGGDLAWSWSDEESFRRYGGQRKFAQKAGLRANTALGLAIANRLMSALHAARQAAHATARPQGWRLDVNPGLDEPGRYRAALTTNF